jgi:magnesium transporter
MLALVLDKKTKKKKIVKNISDLENKNYKPLWINISDSSNIESIQKYLKADFDLLEDILEDQRPRFTTYKRFNILVLHYPVENFFETRETIQITFILFKNLVISINNRESNIIKNAFKKLKNIWISKNSVLSEIIDEFTEKTIDLIEMYDDIIDEITKIILKEEYDKSLIYKIISLKTNQHYLTRILNANIDAITKLIVYENIDDVYFEKNIKNRLLYALDINETIKEELDNLMSLYMSLISNKMNEKINDLTVLATAFMIPTLISGFFGMNVNVPKWDFTIIVIGSILLSLIFAWVIFKIIKS